MKFYMPVRVFDEQECVKNHAKELCSFGKKALIVTGKNSSFSNGSFDDATEVLRSNGIEFEVFSDVTRRSVHLGKTRSRRSTIQMEIHG